MSRHFLLVTALVAALAAPSLSARLHVWKGTESTLFSDPRNWLGGSPAGDAEAELVFPVAVRQAVVNDLDGLTVKAMRFETDGYRVDGKPIALVEGAEVDAEDVEFGCELVFEGETVDEPARRHLTPAAAKPANVFTIEQDTITARVTPGAEVTWQGHFWRGVSDSRAVLSGDIDRDGVVRWELPFTIPKRSVISIVDHATREVHVTTGDGAAPDATPVAWNFLRDQEGDYSSANVSAADDLALHRLSTLWIRPGVGAWRGFPSVVYATDDSGTTRMLLRLSSDVPIEGSPRLPDGIRPGDFFIGTIASIFGDRVFFGGSVDERLEDAPSLKAWIAVVNGQARSRASEAIGTATILVIRGGSSERPATVRYRTEDVTAKAGVHYHHVEGTLAFGRGEVLKEVLVPLIDDDVDDYDRTFRLALSDATGASTLWSALHTIVDDDSSPRPVIGSVSVPEGGDGEHEAMIGVAVEGTTRRPLQWKWQFDGGPLLSPRTGTLLFEPGETYKAIPVRYAGDEEPAADRVIQIEMSEVSIRVGGGTLYILDDDSLGITPADVVVEEGKKAKVTITLSEPQTTSVTVEYHTQPGFLQTNANDYVPASGTITFKAGETEKQVVVATLEDAVAEDDEIALLILENPTGSALVRRRGEITIRDDGDMPAVTIEDAVIEEGQVVETTVVITPTSQRPIGYVVTPVSGTADVRDFQLLDQFVSFHGNSSAPVLIRANADLASEQDETFTLQISNAANPGHVLATGTVTIKDTTRIPFISIADVNLREGATASFAVTLSEVLNKPVSFRVRTVGDTAEEGTDFEPVSNVYTIEPGELGTTIDVKVVEDLRAERHETFAVELSQPWNAAIGDGVGRGRIFDDDDPAVPVFETSNVSVSEDAGVTRFTVTLARAMGMRKSITFGTMDGAALAGEDYLASHGELTFEAGETSKTIDIALVNDAKFEEDETFTLRLANGLEATATIVNDDTKGRSRSVRH